MKVAFRQSFVRDLNKTRDRQVLERIQRAIEQAEAAANISQIDDLKKLTGARGRSTASV